VKGHHEIVLVVQKFHLHKLRNDSTGENKTAKHIDDGTNKKSFGVSITAGMVKLPMIHMSISGVEVFGSLDSGSYVTLLLTAIRFLNNDLWFRPSGADETYPIGEGGRLASSVAESTAIGST